MTDLLLDSSKIAWHTDRVEAWENHERIAPVSIDMALTRACQASCLNCYAQLQEPDERFYIDVDTVYRFLDDCAEMGVRGISLISDGESTLSPAYIPFILRASELGIDVGNATNGWRMFPEVAEEILPHLKWVRFTVLAGDPRTFARMMSESEDNTHLFWTAMHNISEAVQIRRKKNLDVTLSIQTFVTPDDGPKLRQFAQLGIDTGVQVAVVKHTSDDEFGSFGVEYDRYPEIYGALHEVEAMSTEQTQVVVKWNKIRTGNKPEYKRFWAAPFFLQFSGSGLVAPTGMFFSTRYAKWWLGNYTQERFIDIWKSDRYWEVMNALASPQFDSGRSMGALPIQFYTNQALDRHVKGIERIVRPDGPDPKHVNFL